MATQETKNLDYYMGLSYEVVVKEDREGGGWFTKVPDLPGCMTFSETFEGLWEMVEDAKRGYLEVSLEHGDPISEPRGR